MTDPAVLESNRLFAGAWEFWARRSRAGEVAAPPGLTAPWMNVEWPMANLTFLAGPVRDGADLDVRVEAALAHARGRGRAWGLFLCRELLPEGLRVAFTDRLARHGLTPIGSATGMAAARLLPPRRPLPELELRPVGDGASRRIFSEINAVATDQPVAWVLEGMDVDSVWDEAAFGFLGCLDGVPVTTAETIAIDGVLYVAMVATLPGYRNRGCAEAVMRHSLARAREATGIERTVLHASPAGRALYQEMGYRKVASFVGFAPAGFLGLDLEGAGPAAG